MIMLLSPSKRMEMTPVNPPTVSQPAYLEQSARLIANLRRLSKAELMQLMAISDPLATLNQQRYREWQPPFTTANAKPAVLAFTGDAYEGLGAHTLQPDELAFAQQHLRILCALYGWLRPLDLIQPYRLEMGRPLPTRGAPTLYAFWGEILTAALNAEPGELVVNLASQEYAKAINPTALQKQLVSPLFKDAKHGQFKIISVYAKRARGMMARFIIQHRITTVEGLTAFAEGGYRYDAENSRDGAPAFVRGPL